MNGHYIRFLSAHALMDWYFSGAFARGNLPAATACNDLVLLARNARRHLPDRHHQAELELTLGMGMRIDAGCIAGALMKSLDELSRPMLKAPSGGKIFVVQSRFEDWQDVLSELSPLPLVAYRYFSSRASESALLAAVEHSTLPSCSSGNAVADGVDLHMHLNGTTEADFVWQYCLENQEQVADEFAAACKSPSVVRFYKQCHIASPGRLSSMIRLGRWLQESIARKVAANSTIPGEYDQEEALSQRLSMHMLRECMKGGGTSLSLGRYQNRTNPGQSGLGNLLRPYKDTYLHPLALLQKHPDPALSSVQHEARLLYHAYRLMRGGDRFIPLLLHCYLLTQACVFRMTVQHREQIGFEQFQHITNSGLREHLEKKSYGQRFKQLVGMYGSPYLDHIEGRFSPKSTLRENLELLANIGSAFSCASPRPSRTLTSAAHFIKKEDTGPLGVCRHRELRADILKRADSLLAAHAAIGSAGILSIAGKDAAANELDAPPEVFAPAFSRLGRGGISRTTFHVGEDFRHLLSGLRAIDEAVEFLRLREKDRLGHATALGFPPRLWRQRVGKRIYLSVGEWLDNLVWLLGTARTSLSSGARKGIECDIDALAKEVYPSRRSLTPAVLFQAWKLRYLDPLYLDNPFIRRALEGTSGHGGRSTAAMSIDPFDCEAMADFLEKARSFPDAFGLFYDYHLNRSAREKYARRISIRTDAVSEKDLIAAQEYVTDAIIRKELVIEVMPTSNKRISPYASYGEHHMTAWSAPCAARRFPDFVICTDDPGIFATNLKNELSHFANSVPDKRRADALARVCGNARACRLP